MGITNQRMPVWDPYEEETGGNSPEAIQSSKVILWKGHCSVHQMFKAEHVHQFREKYPNIKILVHPECPQEVNDLADVSGSTPSVLADDPPETPLPGAGVPAETPLASAAVPTKASSEVPAKPSHAPRARTGADHALVAFHLQPEMLAEGFTALLDDGTRVPAETFRRVACDCAMVGTLEHGGEVLDVGRRSRAISAGMRRALDRRDAGCRFPGCDCTRFLHAHHIEHWALGGETSLSNLVSLCPFHHRLAHEGGYRVHAGDDAPVFTTPRGHIIPAVPAETRPTGDLRDAVGRLRIDDDPRDTLHWVQRPDYGYVVHLTYAIHPSARYTGTSFVEDSRVTGCNAVGLGIPFWEPGGGENHPDGVLSQQSIWIDGAKIVEDGIIVSPSDLAKSAEAMLPVHQ